MNKSITIPMLCVAFWLALVSPSHSQGEIKFCPTELKIAGQCGIKGGWDCFLAINAKVGASGMAMNCSCQPLPNNGRNCKCMVVCRD
ncbi:hypothetical protein ERO13_D10G135600v2 [Gossypium hirsutum]|uniref:Defensin-like protein 244 n=1 Tax=Gossypium hirsutum TaxID=3635 RepID=A0ABM3ATL2_GOSHI|nr:putative defensin-like protein 244 [Gossypium hirsutum]KAG4126083.1 hypothetical protein ERO13_D10G135600v2 [Gossypium hirsutum]